MKQTAVEWLVEQLKERGYAGEFPPHLLFEQAKEMEKEQNLEIGLLKIELKHTKTLLASCEKALEDRDNQAEKMYSEEDMHKAYCAGSDFLCWLKDEQYYMFKKWFEKFKKEIR